MEVTLKKYSVWNAFTRPESDYFYHHWAIFIERVDRNWYQWNISTRKFVKKFFYKY